MPFSVGLLILLAGGFSWIFFFTPTLQSRLGWGWMVLTKESRRILGWENSEIPPEEKRVREQVILKKMREASAGRDWRSLAPEYPHAKKSESSTQGERMKALRDSPEFSEIEKELKGYLKRKIDLFIPDPPLPSQRDMTDVTRQRDRGAEKIMERLLSTDEKASQEKPLEENLLLGIKGPLAARKILERPNPPSVKVKVEAEIEMTLYVLPNGIVDRVIPAMKGDSELERVAVQYLKQWRFVALSKDRPQVDQWGVIPIKFRLQ